MKTKFHYLSIKRFKVLCIATLSLLISLPGHSEKTDSQQRVKMIKWSDLATVKMSDKPTRTDDQKDELPTLPNLGQFGLSSDSWGSSVSHQLAAKTPPNSISDSLKPYLSEQQAVKISGYIVPLEFSAPSNTNRRLQGQYLNSFFLVPNFGAILFDEPPPQTQVIYVRLTTPQPLVDISKPVWITGHLERKPTTQMGTTASYTMRGLGLSAYNSNHTNASSK